MDIEEDKVDHYRSENNQNLKEIDDEVSGFTDEEDLSYMGKVNEYLAQAVPSILCLLLLRVQYMVNMSVIGHMGDKALIAGVGLANMIVNILVVSGAYGMNGALETLVTQGYGAGKLDLCGVYLNCSRFVFLVFFVPSAIFLLFTE